MSLRTVTVALSLLLCATPLIESEAFAAPQGQQAQKGAQKGGAQKSSAKSKAAEDDGKSDKKKGKGKKGKAQIEETGIESFDAVFAKVAPIDATLSEVETTLRSAKVNLTDALALEKGTPLKDAIAELQKTAGNKLTLVTKGQVPQLAVTDAVPSNVQSAVDGVNGLMTDLTNSMDDLQALPAQIDALVKQTQKFPSQLKSEFDGNLLDTLFALPKVSSALKSDLALVTGLPDRVTAVTARSTEIISVVTSTFASGK